MNDFLESMKAAIADGGYKEGDVVGYSCYEDGTVASVWPATGRTWEDTFRITECDVK